MANPTGYGLLGYNPGAEMEERLLGRGRQRGLLHDDGFEPDSYQKIDPSSPGAWWLDHLNGDGSGYGHPRYDQQYEPAMKALAGSIRRRDRDYGVPVDPDGIDDPFVIMAHKLGVPFSRDVSSMMQQMWARSPTDDVGQLIEDMSSRTGIPPPWAGGQGGGLLAPAGGPLAARAPTRMDPSSPGAQWYKRADEIGSSGHPMMTSDKYLNQYNPALNALFRSIQMRGQR